MDQEKENLQKSDFTQEEIDEIEQKAAQREYLQTVSKSGGNKKVINEAERKRKRKLQKIAKRKQRDKS